jgi:hypothetical protein
LQQHDGGRGEEERLVQIAVHAGTGQASYLLACVGSVVCSLVA